MQRVRLLILLLAGCVATSTATSDSTVDPTAEYSCATTYDCDGSAAYVYTFVPGVELEQHESIQRSECEAFQAAHCAGTSACDVVCDRDP